MWGKILKGVWFIVKNAPAVVEVVKKARGRHKSEHKEEVS